MQIIITSHDELIVRNKRYDVYGPCFNFVLENPVIPVAPKTLEYIMSTKLPPTSPTPEPSTPVTEEFKEQNQKYNLSKFEFDLYHEEYDVREPVIRVRRVSMPNKGEKWKIMIDNKLIFAIESAKISKKEKEYLQTIDGFNFILAQAKKGIKSLNGFRTELKKVLGEKSVKTGP